MAELKSFLISSHGRLWNALAVLLYGKHAFKNINYKYNSGKSLKQIINISHKQNLYQHFTTLKDNSENRIFYLETDGNITPVQNADGIQITFTGKGNLVIISRLCKFQNCKMRLGVNNFCIIEESNYNIINLIISAAYCNGGSIIIGKNFSCHGVHMTCAEGKNIFVGDDVMCSYDINIWNSDGHSIFDNNGTCFNFGMDVYLGNHVWLAHGVEILKGGGIPDGCVVGAKSIISKKFDDRNCVLAGSPARVIKREIAWDRKSPAFFK